MTAPAGSSVLEMVKAFENASGKKVEHKVGLAGEHMQ
jgi:hypothetical protein